MISGSPIGATAIAAALAINASSGITLAPASVTATWVIPAQTLSGTGSSTLAPASVTSTWVIPAQTLVLAGTITLPSAEAVWVVPAQTLAGTGTSTLAPASVVVAWVVPNGAIVGGIQAHGNLFTLYELLGDDMPDFNVFVDITPDNTANFKGPDGRPCRAIYVGAGGDVTAVAQSGVATLFAGMTAGSYIVGNFIRVNSTGTSAAQLRACYSA